MKAARGASRMQMRFVLQSRTPERRGWRELAAPGLGIWNTADAAARRYVYEKRVEALAAPGRYRMVVQFRWLEGTARVAQQRRVTRICRQPDLRPDLVARKLAVRGGGRYVIRVANRGLSSSGPFAIVVAAGATTLASGGSAESGPEGKGAARARGRAMPAGFGRQRARRRRRPGRRARRGRQRGRRALPRVGPD
jgi:hypothetical protein